MWDEAPPAGSTHVGLHAHSALQGESQAPVDRAALLQQLVKTMALVVEVGAAPATLQPVLAIAPGDRQVSSQRVLEAVCRLVPQCARAEAGSVRIRKAQFSECTTVFGYGSLVFACMSYPPT